MLIQSGVKTFRNNCFIIRVQCICAHVICLTSTIPTRYSVDFLERKIDGDKIKFEDGIILPI